MNQNDEDPKNPFLVPYLVMFSFCMGAVVMFLLSMDTIQQFTWCPMPSTVEMKEKNMATPLPSLK